MNPLRSITDSITHLFYPVVCTGCGSDSLSAGEQLCLTCIGELPFTQYEKMEQNPVSKIFWGRVPLKHAYALLYFHKGQLVQQLVHQLKYKANRSIGVYLGELMGLKMMEAQRHTGIDYLIPLPLFKKKEFKRGYNQADILCQGISAATGIPVLSGIVRRQVQTETQTHKHRMERWENVADSFKVFQPELLEGKHLLVVDDVVTTGATLEACCAALHSLPGTTISVATLAVASK